MDKVTGYVTGVNGNLVAATFSGSVRKNEVGYVLVGDDRLKGEVIRVNGDTVDIMAAFGEFGNQCFRVMFYDDEVEAIQSIDPVTGQRIHSLDSLTLYPTSLFVTTKERINSAVQQIYLDLGKQVEFFEQSGRMVEAQRLKQRVEYDVEMIKELG